MTSILDKSAYEDYVIKCGCGESVMPCSIPDSMNIQFIERVLKGLPSNIFLKDDQCRYVFATKYWAHIEHDDAEWDIKGKTDFDIRRNAENAQKAYEEDLKILETGNGCSYVIREELDGADEYLEVIKSPVFNEEHQVIGIVGLINNVTEKEKMRMELERLANTDPMTGLLNRHRFSALVRNGLSPEQCPAAVFMADCDRLKVVNDNLGHTAGNQFICMTADLLRDVMPEGSLIFRTGGDEFVTFAFNVDKDGAKRLKETFCKRQSEMFIGETSVSVSIGCELVDDPNADLRVVLDKVDSFMYEDKGAPRADQN